MAAAAPRRSVEALPARTAWRSARESGSPRARATASAPLNASHAALGAERHHHVTAGLLLQR